MRASDVALACRNLLRNPGFAAVAISLIALAAGANAAVYSVVRGVLLRPLPFSDAEALVAVWPDTSVSNEDLGYWRDRTRSFSELAAQSPGWMMGLVAGEAEPLKVTGARTSDNLFRTLGARAAMGRVIEPGDALPGRDRVVVLSDRLWRERFASDSTIVGRIVQLDQEPFEVVGVMPAGFEILRPGTDLWTPLTWEPGTSSFRTSFSEAIGRLAPGVTTDAATHELRELVPSMRRDLAHRADWGETVRVAPLQEAVTGSVRLPLLIMLGAVGLILMLAAVNLGTLVLGRSIARASEMAVRTALGASRGRLVRQVLVEHALLAVLGGAAGIALATAALPALVSRIPPDVPRVEHIALDWAVLATVLAVSLGAALAASIFPAAVAARPSLQPLLRQSRSTETPGRRRVLGALVAVQIALAVVLGIGAMLMLRTLWNLQRVDPGFNPDGVLTFRLQTTSRYRELDTGLPYLRRMQARVAALPGVTGVGAIGHLPLGSYAWSIPLRRADQPAPDRGDAPSVGWRFVDGAYFDTMGIPIRYGRAFAESDSATGPRVAIVNETLARQFFGEPALAIGQLIAQRGGGRTGETTAEIVGVAGDVRHRGLHVSPEPELYRPVSQTFMFPMAFVVRTTTPPAGLAAAVRQAGLDVDSVVPVAEVQPYATLIAGTLSRTRLLGVLLTIFAGAGLLLGLIGVYGVSAYRVRQREREIGIRLALGAGPARITSRVLAQGAGHALSGLALGLPAAFVLSRAMTAVIHGVTPHDPLTFVSLSCGVLIVVLSACYLPARRASRLDPVKALRPE